MARAAEWPILMTAQECGVLPLAHALWVTVVLRSVSRVPKDRAPIFKRMLRGAGGSELSVLSISE